MQLMSKWKKFTDCMFGDFEGGAEIKHGVILNDRDDYVIGRFDTHNKKDGLSIHRLKDGGAVFSKFSHDKALYPITHLRPDGHIIIKFKEDEEGNITTLDLNTQNCDFHFYLTDKDGTIINNSINFDGRKNKISFNRYEEGKQTNKIDIEKEFIPSVPIVCFDEVHFPTIESFDDFSFNGDEEYSVCESSDYSRRGIGVINWSDGSYAVGEWRSHMRNGWQIYQFGDYYSIFRGTTTYNGIQIRVHDNGTIQLFYCETINAEKSQYDISWALEFIGESLYFTEFYFDDNFSTCSKGSALKLSPFDTVEFINWTSTNFTTYDVEAIYNFDKLFKKDGEKENSKIDKDDPEYKMLSLVGQNEAKKEFVRLRAYLQKKSEHNIPINMIFTGGNGVGKSTVARLIMEILYKYDAINKKSYQEVNAKSLFNTFTGETSSRIDEVYREAKGGVLLIDDFHYLNEMNNSNIKEGINKIANLMDSDPRTTIILVDTKYNMKQVVEDNFDILQDKIRFRIDFSDFTRDELKQILLGRIKEKEYRIEDDALNALLDVIYLAKSYGNNINASAAFSILEEVIVAQNVRTVNSDSDLITRDDVSSYINSNDIAFIDQKTGGQSDARKKLDELVGLDHIKDMVDDLIAYFSINRGKRVDFHMVFTGNPGTGKTEVARIIGKLLRQEGILGSSRFLEVTRRDLIGQYIGQTAIKTHDVIDKAMGGVLYIDEAYSLAYGGEKDFGGEAIAELLKAMEDRRGEFCVIMAGYTSEMKKLFDMNPGLKSRIKFDLDFPDYTDEEFNKIAHLFLKRDNNVMSEENINILVKLVSHQRQYPNFANVRTLREYISRIQIKQARRIRQSQFANSNPHELTIEDIYGAFGEKEVNLVLKENPNIRIKKLDPKVLERHFDKDEPRMFLDNKDIVSEAVVAIYAKGEHSGESTGFIVSKDGYAITCAHCVEGAETITVRRRIIHHNKHLDIKYAANLVSIDKEADVAIIKLDAEPGDEFEPLVLEKNTIPEPLTPIYILGYPFGVSRFDEMSINEGKVASYQKGTADRLDQINLDISAKGGNSGSPIIDAKTSRVIGILVGASLSPHGEIVDQIIFCRPISFAWDLLKREHQQDEEEMVIKYETFDLNNKSIFIKDIKIPSIGEKSEYDDGSHLFKIENKGEEGIFIIVYERVAEYAWRKLHEFTLTVDNPSEKCPLTIAMKPYRSGLFTLTRK